MDTIEGMRTFAAVVTSRSFTAAARHLGTSTKLTSKYVQQLEERLGVQLLNRTTRSLALTEIGRAYFERCVDLLEDFDELEAAMQDRQSTPRGQLRISAPTTFGETHLTRAIAVFLSDQPDISIDLRLSNRFVNIVDEGFDLAIRISDLDDSSLTVRKLAPASITLCASPDYLAQHQTPKTPDDLKDHNCIIDSNYKKGPHWPLLYNGKIKTFNIHGRFHVNGATAAREMAVAGQGIALCPSYLIDKYLASGELVALLQDYNAFELGLYALFPPNRHLAKKVRVFVDHLVEYFAQPANWDQH